MVEISIIMATFNRAHLIEESLKSILNQTYKDYECLVINDGSTDNTKIVFENTVGWDSRFKYLDRDSCYAKGLPGCRNMGIDLAKGKFIIFFDDDDIVHPQNLEVCRKELIDTRYSFCRYQRNIFHGNFDHNFDYSLNYSKFQLSEIDIEAIIKNEIPFNSCAVMWRKSCFGKERFVESLMYAEEWEYYTRIISKGLQGVSIGKTLFFGRKHLESNTGEYYKKKLIRVKSKENAIFLIALNLKKRKMFSNSIALYLSSLVIGFRNKVLLLKILNLSGLGFFNQWKLHFKFLLYPIWLVLNRLKKRYSL